MPCAVLFGICLTFPKLTLNAFFPLVIRRIPGIVPAFMDSYLPSFSAEFPLITFYPATKCNSDDILQLLLFSHPVYNNLN